MYGEDFDDYSHDVYVPDFDADDMLPPDIDEPLGSDEPWDGFNSDVEADADVLRSCGWGTDEDYGYYGDESDF